MRILRSAHRTAPLGGNTVRVVYTALLCVWLLVGMGCHGPVPWSESRPQPGRAFDPPALYLTWRNDPTTTMTVQWHSLRGESDDKVVYSRLGSEDAQWVEGSHHELTGSERTVHVVELTGLEPDTEYRFRIDDSATFRFRTMPRELIRPIRFIDGGDVDVHDPFEAMCRRAAAQDPSFVIIGGDIAYTDGSPANVSRWCVWLDVWKRTMIDSQGRIIPLLVAIGNHEVQGGFQQSPDEARIFYELFSNLGDREGRAVLDFGDWMSVILLDSEHSHPIPGPQTQWLEQTLGSRTNIEHLFVSYHVPAFPSVRSESDRISQLLRKTWVPMFEEHGVDVVFEHHDHAYKRTHLIRANAVDATGVLYLGDGGWSVTPRAVKDRWYLAHAEAIQHFILTTIDGSTRTHQAMDVTGRVFDEISHMDRAAAPVVTQAGAR